MGWDLIKLSSVVLAALGLFCPNAMADAGPYRDLEAALGPVTSLQELLSQPDRLAHYKKALQHYYGQERFQCETFEQIVTKLRVLADKVPGFAEELWQVRGNSRLVLYRTDKGPKNQREAWELSAPPRKLHAIWNDPTQRGCSGEDCGKAEITSPERWAAALPGSELYLFHREGRFQGTGLSLHTLVKNNQPVSLISITGVGPLQEAGLFADSPTGSARATTLLDRFLENRASAELVTVEYDNKDQSVARLVKVKANQAGGAFAGYLDEFKPADPMAQAIATASPRRCFARKGKGTDALNLFAGFGNGNNASPSSVNFGSPEGAASFINSLSNPDDSAPLVGLSVDQRTEAGRSAEDILNKSKDDFLREKAALALRMLSQLPSAIHRGIAPVGNSAVTQQTSSGGANRTPAGTTATARGNDPFLSAFRRGLSDPNPAVRAFSASALSDRGDRSPATAAALSDAIQGKSPGTPKAFTPSQLAEIAARSKNDSGQRFARPDLNSLGTRAAEEQDPERRRRLLDQFARGFLSARDPDAARETLQPLIQNHPERETEIVDAINRTTCPGEETEGGAS